MPVQTVNNLVQLPSGSARVKPVKELTQSLSANTPAQPDNQMVALY
jgi:hypothetical protein